MWDEGWANPLYRRFGLWVQQVRDSFGTPTDRPLGITIITVVNLLAAALSVMSYISALNGALNQKSWAAISDPFFGISSYLETQQKLDAAFLAAVGVVFGLVVGVG